MFVQAVSEHQVLRENGALLETMAIALASPLLQDDYVANLLELTFQLCPETGHMLDAQVKQRRHTPLPVPTEMCASCRLFDRPITDSQVKSVSQTREQSV